MHFKKLLPAFVFLLFLNNAFAQEFTEVARIIAPDGKLYNKFAHTVSIDGDYAVVGSYVNGTDENNANNMNNAGAAYFMKRDASGAWQIVQKVVASDRKLDDRFATIAVLSGRYAMIGAPNEDEGVNGTNPSTNNGSVYVFWRNDEGIWIEVQKLDVPAPNARLGFPIHLDGNRAIIAARQKTIAYRDENNVIQFHNDTGGAYIFELMPSGQWALTATLDYSEPDDGDNFGKGLYFFGDYAVIGCPKKSYYNEANIRYRNMGAIYIFKKQPDGNWLEIKKIIPSDISSDLSFGESVVMNDQYIMVGANKQSLQDETGYTLPNAGVVYSYKKKDNEDDWEEDQIIQADIPLQNAYFGEDVQLKGNTLIVGAPKTNYCKDNICYGGGAAYIFTKEQVSGTWEQKQIVHGSSVTHGDQFGLNTCFDGTTLMVGAMDHPNEDESIWRIGAAFIFENIAEPNPSDIEINISSLADISEDDTEGQFVFRLSESIQEDTTINYTIAGTATNGEDYSLITTTVTIPAGQTEFILPIAAIDDTILEWGGEDILITLESTNNGVVLGTNISAQIHIADNESVTVTILATQDASENGQEGIFTITLSDAIPENTEINFTVSGTAKNGVDYNQVNGVLSIEAGQTEFALTFSVIDDAILEWGGEEISITLEATNNEVVLGSNTNARIHIADNESVAVNIVATQDASENGQEGIFTITLSDTIPENTEITYSITGNAEVGSDFDSKSGIISIPMNTTSISIPITSIDDNLVEITPELLTLKLESVNNGVVLGVNNTATIELIDNDISEVNFANAIDATEDGDVGVFNLTLSKPISQQISLNFVLSGEAQKDTDYTIVSTTLIIPENTTTATLSIYAIDDDLIETDGEAVQMAVLSNYEKVRLGTNSTGLLTILDNDYETIEEPVVEPELIVYPNPTSSNFYLSFGAQGTKNVTIAVFDSLGKLVYQAQPADGQDIVEIKAILAQGAYLIKTTINGEILVKRLIKQ